MISEVLWSAGSAFIVAALAWLLFRAKLASARRESFNQGYAQGRSMERSFFSVQGLRRLPLTDEQWEPGLLQRHPGQ